LPEIRRFTHSWHLLNVKENNIASKACFGKKLSIFIESLTLNLVILTKFKRKFGLCFILRILHYYKVLMAKFGLLNFLGHASRDVYHPIFFVMLS